MKHKNSIIQKVVFNVVSGQKGRDDYTIQRNETQKIIIL
jgi:hypothetical protein